MDAELVKALWKDMISSPWIASFGVLLICLFIFKNQIGKWIDKKLESQLVPNFKTKYTRKDLLEHPILKDLDYWLSTGIDFVKIEKSYAKELIMKDLLVIKFTVIKETISKFLKKENIEDMSLETLKAEIFSAIREVNSKKVIGWRNSGIPEIFITKYLTMQKLGSELTFDTVKVFMSRSIVVDNYTRCYLIMSVIENQLSNIYATAVSTALSLNGDLNGIVYKGVIIGKNLPSYAVPNPISKELIETKLEELLLKSHASRAAILLFHDYKKNDTFSGKFSMIYESCAPGIKEEKPLVQFIPAYVICDYEEDFKNSRVCVKTFQDVNYELRELYQSQGNEKLIAYPLTLNGEIKGFIGLTWDYLERFDRDSKDIDFNHLLIGFAEDINKMILGR